MTLVCCFLLSLFININSQQNEEYDVIIMGAGIAGISAAKTLYEANITNILIIEAQNYIGGRTAIVNFSNTTVNAGASWIHGVCIDKNLSKCAHDGIIPNATNPMLTAAYKYNISFAISNYEDQGFVLDFGGTQHNITDSNNSFEKFLNAQECINNIINNMTLYNTQTADDMSYAAALYLCGWRKPLKSIDKTAQWIRNEFETGSHAKWGSIEAMKHKIDTFYGTQDLFVIDPRGFNGITLGIADEFLDIDNIQNEPKIILNSPITTIEYDENGVMVTVNDNEQYSAKYGIVTFSLGVLQSDIVEFIPKLPSWKIDALLSFDFADYTPIYIKWPYNFWDNVIVNMSEFIILNDDRFGFFTWIYNLDHPSLLNGSLIWRFDISLDIAQLIQYQNINDTIKLIIDIKLSHYFDNIPDPEEIFVAKWHKNRYVQGSYSGWPINFDYDKKQALRWHINHRLFFSGEACSDECCVHGAYLDGNKIANQIIACMGYHSDFDCPHQYVPPSNDVPCQIMKKEDIFSEFGWLWIILSVILGIILGYLFAKYCNKINIFKNKVDSNYGSVEDVAVPMVTQNTTQPH